MSAILGRQSSQILALVQNPPGFGGQQTHDAFQQRGLAHAVAAHEAGA